MSAAGRTTMGTGPVGAPRPLHDRPEALGASTASASDPAAPAGPEVEGRSGIGRLRVTARSWVAALGRPSRAVPLVVAALVIAVAAAVATRTGDDGPRPGEAIVDVHGTVVVHRSAGPVETVTDRTRLVPGDRMEVRSGTADLELADDVRYAARAAEGSAAATDLTMAKVPELEAGPLLVVAPNGTALASGGGRVSVIEDSVARVTRSAAVRLQVYHGEGTIGSAGAEQLVTARRQAEIVAAGELSDVRPVTYRASDSWDRQYLEPAISLDSQVGALLRGMRADRVDGTVLAERLRRRTTGAPASEAFRRMFAQRADPLNASIGVAIVGEAEGSSYTGRWTRVFLFRDDGAPWGLVAMDLEVAPDDVMGALGRALDGTSVEGTNAAAAEVALGALAANGAAPSAAAGTPVTTPDGTPVTTPDGTPVTVPGGQPAVTVPGGSVPRVTVPGGTVPRVTLPPSVVPGVTLPPITTLTPGATLPPVTLPPITVPPVTIAPGVTLPHVTLPPVTVLPGVTVPPVTVPKVTLPPLPITTILPPLF